MINNFFDGFHYDWKKALHVGDAKTKNLAVFFGKLKGIYRPEPLIKRNSVSMSRQN